MMEYARIPGTSLDVSRVALGTWAIGGWMWGGTDEAESIATIREAVEHGINLIDTAPVYGFGRSEEIVGKAIAHEQSARARAASPPKSGLEWERGSVFRNASRARILRRDRSTPCVGCEPTISTSTKSIGRIRWCRSKKSPRPWRMLFEQGKIGAIGVSNFSVLQMERFRRVAPLHVLQPPYNLFEREIEAEILPYCRKNKIATFGYGALCRGLLSGRMRADTKFEGDDLRRTDPKFQQPRFAQYLAAVERLDQLARRRFGKRVIHLAVRWMLDQGITSALWGARHPAQLQPVDEVNGLVARCPRNGGDRSHPRRHHQRSGRAGIHGAAGARFGSGVSLPGQALGTGVPLPARCVGETLANIAPITTKFPQDRLRKTPSGRPRRPRPRS